MDLARAALKEKTVLLELVFSNFHLQILRLSIKIFVWKVLPEFQEITFN
jgi:hypothetical protein